MNIISVCLKFVWFIDNIRKNWFYPNAFFVNSNIPKYLIVLIIVDLFKAK